METLAQDVLALTVHKLKVVCPRCRETKLLLKKARKGSTGKEPWTCDKACKWSQAAGPGRTHKAVPKPAHQEGEVDGGSDAEASLEESYQLAMGTQGFATWVVGLRGKKRQAALDCAIEAANQAIQAAGGGGGGDVAATTTEAALKAAAQVEHASRALER